MKHLCWILAWARDQNLVDYRHSLWHCLPAALCPTAEQIYQSLAEGGQYIPTTLAGGVAMKQYVHLILKPDPGHRRTSIKRFQCCNGNTMLHICKNDLSRRDLGAAGAMMFAGRSSDKKRKALFEKNNDDNEMIAQLEEGRNLCFL